MTEDWRASRRVQQDAAHPKFAHPYNFVSTPPRQDAGSPGDLADQPPLPRGVAAQDTYSGRIPITITERTPLLIMDQARATPADDDNTRQLSLRRGVD